MNSRQAVRKKAKVETTALERRLRNSFRGAGQAVRIHVREASAGLPVWPLVEVLAVVELAGIHEWPALLTAGWEEWRSLVDENLHLTAIPRVNGLAVAMCGVRGLGLPVSNEEDALSWIEHVKLTPAPDVASRSWGAFLDAALNVAQIESQAFGEDGRPEVERAARRDARRVLAATKAALDERLPSLLHSMSVTIIDIVDSDPQALVESQFALLRGELTDVAEVLLDSQYACYSIDLGTAPISHS